MRYVLGTSQKQDVLCGASRSALRLVSVALVHTSQGSDHILREGLELHQREVRRHLNLIFPREI